MTTETKLKAFHGDPALKDRVVKAMRNDIDLENLVKGTYLDANGKGCHVGCVVKHFTGLSGFEDNYHKAYAEFLGIPEELPHLFDTLFEGCSPEFSKQLSLRILEAIKEGSDLSGVADEIKLWILRNELHYDRKKWPDVTAAIEGTASLLERQLQGDFPTKEEWYAARCAARYAAWCAAGSAAWSARSAAWSAAWSARYAAESAARSAAWSAAWSEWSAAYERIAEKLLELLSKAV